MINLPAPHRMYITMELPFNLQTTEETTTTKTHNEKHVKKNKRLREFQKKHITEFLPPHNVAPGLATHPAASRRHLAPPPPQQLDKKIPPQKQPHYHSNEEEKEADQSGSSSASLLSSSFSQKNDDDDDDRGLSEEEDSHSLHSSSSDTQEREDSKPGEGKKEKTQSPLPSSAHSTPNFITSHTYLPRSVWKTTRGIDTTLSVERDHHNSSAPAKAMSLLPSKYEFFDKVQTVESPSFHPQLFLSMYARNDLLVQVTRTRRVRRRRHRKTGEVVWEEEIEEDDERTEKVKKEDPLFVVDLKAEVLGVVSREIEITRPADFCYAPYTEEEMEANEKYMKQHHSSSTTTTTKKKSTTATTSTTTTTEEEPLGTSDSFINTDYLQPYEFQSFRTPIVLSYEPAYHPNTSVESVYSVVEASASSSPSHAKHQPQAPSREETERMGATLKREVKEGDDDEDERLILTKKPEEAQHHLTVACTDPLPPPRTQEQLEYLTHSLKSSPTGLLPTDAPTVRLVATLLQHRPVWAAKQLLRVVLGTLPAAALHTIQRILRCLSYTVEKGPFHRLRIRHDHNPYLPIESALAYQHTSLRLSRTSPLGVHLKDFSRSASIGRAVQWVRKYGKEWGSSEVEDFMLEMGEDEVELQVLLLPFRSSSSAPPETSTDRGAPSEAVVKLRTMLADIPFPLLDTFCHSILGGNLFIYFSFYMLRGDVACERVMEGCRKRWYEHRDRHSIQGELTLPPKEKVRSSGWLNEAEFTALRSRVMSLLEAFVTEVIPFALKQVEGESH